MKIEQTGAGPCSFFRTVTMTVSEIFVTVVLKSLADNARMVVCCLPFAASWEKRRGKAYAARLPGQTWKQRQTKRTRGVCFMKEAEDDGEIVIKSMFLHLMTEQRSKVRATSTSRSWKPQEQLVDVLFRTSWPLDDGDKHGSSEDFSSRTTACRYRNTDPWGDHDVSSGDQTVDLPVQQKIFEKIMDVPQQRLSKRAGEQFDDEPVS